MNTDTQTEVKIGTLTSMDLKAMRQADRVCFHTVKGESRIRCIKDVEKRGPFDDREKEYEIKVNASITDYGRVEHSQKLTVEKAACFAMVHSGQFCEIWQGIAWNLKTGDVVTLHWSRDNNSGTVERGGLHVDELQIRVERNKFHFAFSVDTGICEDNSARMTRFA